MHFTYLYVLAACWLALTIWTIRRLGSPSRVSDEFVYRFGVRQFGVYSWIAATAIGTYGLMQANLGHSPLYYAGIFGFFLLPISLWCGWLWGMGMRAFYPRRPKR
jgi:hypothetical protein